MAFTHVAPHVETTSTVADSRYLVPAGRILFSLIFISSCLHLFGKQAVGAAAAEGVPIPQILVPIAGLLALAGGLSIALGYQTRAGAWLIVLFLVPVTFAMHAFWRVSDPQMHQMQQVNFMKNMALLGGALLIAWYGGGPISLDARRAEREG